MNTRLLMSTTAILLAIAGVVLIFLPDEIAATRGGAADVALALQVIGGAWFAFAILDWTGRGGLMGGIYGRPVVLANLTLFVTSALVLLKGGAGPAGSSVALGAGMVCGIFAVAFGIVLFRHPGPPRAA